MIRLTRQRCTLTRITKSTKTMGEGGAKRRLVVAELRFSIPLTRPQMSGKREGSIDELESVFPGLGAYCASVAEGSWNGADIKPRVKLPPFFATISFADPDPDGEAGLWAFRGAEIVGAPAIQVDRKGEGSASLTIRVAASDEVFDRDTAALMDPLLLTIEGEQRDLGVYLDELAAAGRAHIVGSGEAKTSTRKRAPDPGKGDPRQTSIATDDETVEEKAVNAPPRKPKASPKKAKLTGATTAQKALPPAEAAAAH